MTEQQSDAIEIPDDWDQMSDEDQQAWVAAALEQIFPTGLA